jgi:hypothetical protein
VYGGDVVLRLLAFGVALGPSGRALSVDALRERGPARATMPAWPIRLLQIQSALIYFTSGVAKLHGSSWRDGSAIAAALSVPPIARFDLTSILARAPVVPRVMGWLTVAWEIGFPLLVFSSRLGRRLALRVGVAFHLGIIVFLRIHWFGHLMILSYLAFQPAEAFDRAELRLRRLARCIPGAPALGRWLGARVARG